MQGDKPAFAKLCRAGNREQQLGEEPQQRHLLPTGSLPALKSLPSPARAASPSCPALCPAQPQALAVPAPSSPRRCCPSLISPGQAQPCPVPGLSGPPPRWAGPTALSRGDTGDKHFLLALFCPIPAALSPARALLCPPRNLHPHPQRLTAPAQLPLPRHSAIPHPDEKYIKQTVPYKWNFSVSFPICCPSPPASTGRGQSLSQLPPISQKIQQVNPPPHQHLLHTQVRTDHPNN